MIINTRTDKIARLPIRLCNELNTRLPDGQTAALSCRPVAKLSADRWAGLKADLSRRSAAKAEVGRPLAAVALATGLGVPPVSLSDRPKNRLPVNAKTTPESDGGPVAPTCRAVVGRRRKSHQGASAAKAKNPENPN